MRKALRRKLVWASRWWRSWYAIVKALVSTRHVCLAHIIPVRRCNLACTYCNEFDDFSPPVPAGEMLRRVDKLAEFGTSVITISGGEPLLHPELDAIIAHIRRRGAIAGLITNGYLLTPERIERLNRARLDYLQISIDNAQPDEVSKKSLKVLDRKLRWLAEHAEFHVNINSVIGSGIHHPDDALTVARRAVSLGLTSTLGIIHDGTGQLRPLGGQEREVYHAVKALGRQNAFARFDHFQRNISEGKPHDWRCRSGSRYLYICEDGLVHYCSQQRGRPGVPLAEYATADLRREFNTKKHCAPRCTISCVQQVGMLDNWRRAPQTLKPAPRRPKPSSAREPLVHLQSTEQ